MVFIAKFKFELIHSDGERSTYNLKNLAKILNLEISFVFLVNDETQIVIANYFMIWNAY